MIYSLISTLPRSTLLQYPILRSFQLYCSVLLCIVMHCTVLCFTVLHFDILYCYIIPVVLYNVECTQETEFFYCTL